VALADIKQKRTFWCRFASKVSSYLCSVRNIRIPRCCMRSLNFPHPSYPFSYSLLDSLSKVPFHTLPSLLSDIFHLIHEHQEEHRSRNFHLIRAQQEKHRSRKTLLPRVAGFPLTEHLRSRGLPLGLLLSAAYRFKFISILGIGYI